MPLDATEHEFEAIAGEIAELREFLAERPERAYSIQELTEGLYEDAANELDGSIPTAIVTAYVNVLAYHGEIQSCVVPRQETAYYRIAD